MLSTNERPEPGPLTAILTFGYIVMNSSAQTVVSGVTVLEPIMLKEPESSVPVGVGLVVVVDSLQLLINTMAANNTIKGIMNHFGVIDLINYSS